MPTACCGLSAVGHNCHPIQLKLANRDPRTWFHAVIVDISGELLTVRYADRSTAVLWKHRGFDPSIHVGQRAAVCERWSLLSVEGEEGRRLFSTKARVPTWRKSDPPPRWWPSRRWSRRRAPVLEPAVVNLATGEGIAPSGRSRQ